MFRILLPVLLGAALAAQTPAPAPVPAPAAAIEVRVPTYPNSTCPIMGKKVSMALYVDTEVGRFYLCCKPCVRKVLADVPTAHKTAYPAVEEVANERCPVTGEAIGEGKVAVTLQGFRFFVAKQEHVATAQREHQLTLAKLRDAKLKDVGNGVCPVSGKPADVNTIVVIGDEIVRLASPRSVAEVQKSPADVLAKAKASVRKSDGESSQQPRKEAGR
jgi:hypothetical protein